MTKAEKWLKKHDKAHKDSIDLWKNRPQWRKNIVSVNQKGDLEIALPHEVLKPKEALSLGRWIVSMYGKHKENDDKFSFSDILILVFAIGLSGMVLGLFFSTLY